MPLRSTFSLVCFCRFVGFFAFDFHFFACVDLFIPPQVHIAIQQWLDVVNKGCHQGKNRVFVKGRSTLTFT
jgi:hypothetical protein